RVPWIVGAIPTTYSGSEVTPVFGTTDVERHRKSVLRSDPVRPRLALYDPELALDTPPDLSASTGVNALAHCVEALYAKDAGDDERTMALRAAYRARAPIVGGTGEGLGDAGLGGEVCKAAATFVRGRGLPRRLRDRGSPRGDLPSGAEEAMESKSVRANPRPVTRADALRILEAAW